MCSVAEMFSCRSGIFTLHIRVGRRLQASSDRMEQSNCPPYISYVDSSPSSLLGFAGLCVPRFADSFNGGGQCAASAFDLFAST